MIVGVALYVHCAYSVVAVGTTFAAFTCPPAAIDVPDPSAFVFHPVNVYQLSVNADAAFVAVVYFIVTFAGAVPCPLALYVNVAVFSDGRFR